MRISGLAFASNGELDSYLKTAPARKVMVAPSSSLYRMKFDCAFISNVSFLSSKGKCQWAWPGLVVALTTASLTVTYPIELNTKPVSASYLVMTKTQKCSYESCQKRAVCHLPNRRCQKPLSLLAVDGLLSLFCAVWAVRRPLIDGSSLSRRA
jgi:hypothetical protein